MRQLRIGRRRSWNGRPRRYLLTWRRFRAAVELLRACDRMLDRWADADQAAKNDLWRDLHAAADELAEALD